MKALPLPVYFLFHSAALLRLSRMLVPGSSDVEEELDELGSVVVVSVVEESVGVSVGESVCEVLLGEAVSSSSPPLSSEKPTKPRTTIRTRPTTPAPMIHGSLLLPPGWPPWPAAA